MTDSVESLSRSDYEAGNADLSDVQPCTASQAWLELLRCSRLIDQVMTAYFYHEFSSSLSRFDVLIQLRRAGPNGLTTSQLAQRLLASRGNITRLLDRMEDAKLIRRRPCAGDRRISYVDLTRQGDKLLSLMAPAHGAWVNSMFGALSETELSTLKSLLQRVRERVQGPPFRQSTWK